MKRVIGIDLGTTNTCAAYVQHGIPRVIPTEKGYNTLPSVVHFGAGGKRVFGQAAKEQIVLHPKTTLHSTKRLLGRRYDSKAVQELLGFFSYDVVEGEDGLAEMQVGDERVTPKEVAALLLGQLMRYAEAHIGEKVEDAIICVPAYFSDVQRTAVKEAAQLAGLNVVRLCNEPTAASLAYGVGRGLKQRVLVYDLGGGTFDVSVLELDQNVFEVVATGGDNFLGGADFDNRIIAWALEEFKAKEEIDLSRDPAALQRLRSAAELAKCELSLLMTTELRIPYIAERRGRNVDLVLTLSREILNKLCTDLVTRTIEVVQHVLRNKGIDVKDVGEVILVGGMTRMPAVQQALQQMFSRAPKKGVHPDEVVALGAALLGDSMDQIDSVTLIDVISVPLTVAAGAGQLMPLFGQNQTLPAAQSMTLPTARDDQTRMEIDFFQGDGATVDDSDYIGTLVFDGIPARKAGEVKVKVDVELDGEGLVSISAQDTVRNVKQILTLRSVGSPSSLRGRVRDKTGGVQAATEENRPVAETAEKGLRSIVRNILGKK
jgi:molecular chaperone DnaK